MLRPPGPKPHFLIGNIPLAGTAPLNTFRRWAAEYGDIFYYRAAWLHVYFLNRPDLIEYVLVRNPQNFLKDRVIQNSRWLLGTGLLTAEGDAWKRKRRLTQPAFSRDRIAAYARCMTDSAEQMLALWKPGTVVDIHQEMMSLTLRVVVRALFELETMETGKISRSLNTIMRNSIGGRLLMPPFFRFLPLRGMRDVRRAVGDIDSGVYEIIQQHRSGDKRTSGDLLSLLILARDEDGGRMTDEQLRDEVMTFLLAGHETTALALSWALYLLSQDARAEGKLHEEVDRLPAGKLPTVSDLPSLTFVDSVIKETMRLYPPAWSVARTAIGDFELEGYEIPAGANIVMSQWIMHRHPRFFSEPEKFDPDRWDTSACQNLPRFAYFPFGGGPRQCIGASFATTEVVLILATIARKYRLVPVEQMPVLPVPSLTLRAKDPISMRIEARL
jgi:cytochrome P450